MISAINDADRSIGLSADGRVHDNKSPVMPASAKARARILFLSLIVLWGSARRPARLLLLEASSALKKVNNQDDDSNYEQEMDQTAANVADEAKKPQHDQDNNYSPKHGYSFRLSETFTGLFTQELMYSPSFFGTSNRNGTVADTWSFFADKAVSEGQRPGNDP